ncbi:MAG: hypothetical protein A2Y10_08980 [Planctomycetes bacterium GWF2_41_51]|nr:MAG: hypothetical protein A2Y10_08980 [Planctomycetes bacterium GWF2_41_51]
MENKSKKRVDDILSNRMPDRPALGFFAIDSDTASKVLGRETYWRAKAKCQLAFWDGRHDEVIQSWIQDGIELYKKLDIIDMIPVCVMAAGVAPPKDPSQIPPRKIDANTWEDKQGCVYKYSEQTKDITMIYDPGIWNRNCSVENEVWDGTIEEPDNLTFKAADAIIAEFKDKRFVIGPSAGENAWLLLGGMERGLVEIASRPDDIKKIYDSQIEKAIAHDKFYIRPGQHAVMGGEDLACSTGPLINPEMYRKIFLLGFKKRLDAFKQKGQPFFKHCCGDTRKLLDIFVEVGIDCYQSIQTSAGMDIVEVQKKYHDKFAVWGGVNVENLIGGTTEDVRKDVRRVMTEAAPNGRFILGTTHSVAVGTKYDNFMAMLDEFCKWI